MVNRGSFKTEEIACVYADRNDPRKRKALVIQGRSVRA